MATPLSRECAGCHSSAPDSLCCPTCIKKQIVTDASYFCNQACFALHWPTHKAYHSGSAPHAALPALNPSFPLNLVPPTLITKESSEMYDRELLNKNVPDRASVFKVHFGGVPAGVEASHGVGRVDLTKPNIEIIFYMNEDPLFERAFLLLMQCKYEESQPFFRQALDAKLATVPEGSEELVPYYYFYALPYFDREIFPEALTAAQQAYEIFKLARGPEDFTTACMLREVAITRVQVGGQLAQALAEAKNVLRVFKMHVPETHAVFLELYSLLSRIYEMHHDEPQDYKYLQLCLHVIKSNPEISFKREELMIAGRLGWACMTERPKEAIAHFKHHLDLIRTYEDHPPSDERDAVLASRGTILCGLGMAYGRSGLNREAVDTIVEGLNVLHSTNAVHDSVLMLYEAYSQLCSSCCDLLDFKAAKQAARDGLIVHRMLYDAGSRHIKVLQGGTELSLLMTIVHVAEDEAEQAMAMLKHSKELMEKMPPKAANAHLAEITRVERILNDANKRIAGKAGKGDVAAEASAPDAAVKSEKCDRGRMPHFRTVCGEKPRK